MGDMISRYFKIVFCFRRQTTEQYCNAEPKTPYKGDAWNLNQKSIEGGDEEQYSNSEAGSSKKTMKKVFDLIDVRRSCRDHVAGVVFNDHRAAFFK